MTLYNDAGAAILADDHPAAFGRSLRATVDEHSALLSAALQTVFDTRNATAQVHWPVGRDSSDTAGRSFTSFLSAIESDDRIGGVLGLVMDSSERITRSREKSRAKERRFFTRANRVLAGSMELTTMLESIVGMPIPDYADWCEVDLRRPDGKIETFAMAHHDGKKHELAQALVGRVHLDPDADAGSAKAIKTGRTSWMNDVPPAVVDGAVVDPYETRLYKALEVKAFLSVPLEADGETIGALSAVFGDSGRSYGPDDIEALEEFGRRAGLAIQIARDFDREHRVAQSFQTASLPVALPQIEGLRFDAVYRAAGVDAIGGDWYDAVALADGRVVLSIGDVAGKGLKAAVTMGNIRQIIRGIAQVHADPALILDAADRALRLEADGHLVTAFVAVLDPIAMTLTFASAGHPPPLLQYADGRVQSLSDGGLPLGLRQGRNDARGRVIEISGALRLVLYTDGLTEAFRRPLDGEMRLTALLADNAIFNCSQPARALEAAFFEGAKPTDDVAILVVEFDGADVDRAAPSHIVRWHFDAADETMARSVRHEITERLAAHGGGWDDQFAAELVFGELIGNVVRHAPGAVEVAVDWGRSAPVLHLLDRGPGFRHVAILPNDIFSESGRGLFLIASLTDDFHVSKRPSGGSHARAVLSLQRQKLVTVSHAMALAFDMPST